MGGVRKRERTPRPRVRRIFSGQKEQDILKDHGKTIFDLVYRHGMDPFQQQQQLADHREGHYAEKSRVFQQSAEEGGWGGMKVRVDLVVTYGRHAPIPIILYVIFPMPKEELELLQPFGPFEKDRTLRMKPVIGRVVQRYFGPEWAAMGITFLEGAPLASEEGDLIRDILDRNAEKEVLDLRNELLWWYVEPSRLDKNRLGRYSLLGESFSTHVIVPPENLPPDTAAIKMISMKPSIDCANELGREYWHSFEDVKKSCRADRIDQETIKRFLSKSDETGLTYEEIITIVAEPEETEQLLALFS